MAESMNSRLILVEGCPGSGKSSTAQFLCRQLQQAGYLCRWYYEEEMPHPVAATKGVGRAKDFREYGTATLKRWRDFVSRTKRANEIIIIESHFFQDIIAPLLRVDVKPERIGKLVLRMAEFCAPLNPSLFYFHQPDYSAAMRRILDERGSDVEKRYIQRSAGSIYARRRGLQGFDGLVQNWVDVRHIMEQMVGELDMPTLTIDNSARDWQTYYRQIGEFLSLPLERPPAIGAEDLKSYTGTYTYSRNAAPRRSAGATRFGAMEASRRVGGLRRQGALYHHTDNEFTIQLEQGELVMRDYGWLWPINRLIPLKRDVFDLRSWPFQLIFERDKKGVVAGATRKSETTRWQITGQRYPRLGETD
jgi:thymidylate kinase